jgi:hypothetical protein
MFVGRFKDLTSMTDQEQPTQKPRSVLWPLLLGLAPSALILCFFEISSYGWNPGIIGPRTVLLVMLMAALACSVISPVLLVRRGVVWAMAVGLAFFLINMFIALFTGCLVLFGST